MQWTHSFNLKSCVRPSTFTMRHPHARTMPVTAEDDPVRDSPACGLEDAEVGTPDPAWVTPRMCEESKETKRGEE